MPLCGGILISTPPAGSRPAMTLQNAIFVLTPVPSGAGQLTSAASFFIADGGGVAGFFVAVAVTGGGRFVVCADMGALSPANPTHPPTSATNRLLDECTPMKLIVP